MSKFIDEINSTLTATGFDPYEDPHLYWLEDIDDDGFMLEYYNLEANNHFYTVAVVFKERTIDAVILESLRHIQQCINDSVPLPTYISVDITSRSITYTDSRPQDMIFTDGRVYKKFESENFLIYVMED